MDHNFWRILTRVLLVGAFLATGLFVLGHGMSAATPPAALHTPDKRCRRHRGQGLARARPPPRPREPPSLPDAASST